MAIKRILTPSDGLKDSSSELNNKLKDHSNREQDKEPQRKKITSFKIPTHQEVMKRLSEQLNVNYTAVYNGIGAEQALVGYAGITRSQAGAMFRRENQTGHTWFKLCLQPEEIKSLIQYVEEETLELSNMLFIIKERDKREGLFKRQIQVTDLFDQLQDLQNLDNWTKI